MKHLIENIEMGILIIRKCRPGYWTNASSKVGFKYENETHYYNLYQLITCVCEGVGVKLTLLKLLISKLFFD